MVRKGHIKEISRRVLFSDESREYRILFRDFERIREVQFPEFLVQSNNFQMILINRIKKIKKSNTVLFEKNVMVGE